GKLMDAIPRQRFAAPIALAHRLEHRTVRPNLRVAVHADLARRNARECRCLDGRMAVTAIDAKAGDMMLMAEGNRLSAHDAGAGGVIGANELGPGPAHAGDDKNAAEDAHLRQRIEASMKDLGHRSDPR